MRTDEQRRKAVEYLKAIDYLSRPSYTGRYYRDYTSVPIQVRYTRKDAA